MKNIMKNVIAAGGYRLADMRHKIKKLYAMGDLSDAEADELLALAQGGASPDAERPETLKLIRSLAAEVEALKDRVKILEGGESDSGAEQTQHPAWKPWDGISTDYQPGAIVSHMGQLWLSVYAGQNVWEPGSVDERFWEAHVEG